MRYFKTLHGLKCQVPSRPSVKGGKYYWIAYSCVRFLFAISFRLNISMFSINITLNSVTIAVYPLITSNNASIIT